jgi:hypothetical protein
LVIFRGLRFADMLGAPIMHEPVVRMPEYLYAVALSLPQDEKVITVGLPTMLIRGDVFF